MRVTEKRGPRPLARSGSLAEDAYTSIRDSIAAGELAPGSAITERSLAQDLRVSPTPVREALRKLEHEGLIVRSDSRRLRVAEHPAETVDELMEVEALLRAEEARLAARKAGPETLERMRRLLDEARTEAAVLRPSDLLRLARDFDAEIAAAAANPSLRRMIESFAIFGHDERVRTVEHDAADVDWTRRRLADHVEILDALRDRDEDRAEAIMRRHARSAMRRLPGS